MGFGYSFMERAAIAAGLLSLIAGLISPPIVLRRLAFSADGLAHASLGGLAVGLCVLSGSTVPTAGTYGISLLFTCAVAVGIGFLSTRIPSDTAVGASYVAAFSLGVVLLSLKQRGTGHLEHYFFGSLLAVSPLEIQLLAGLATVLGIGLWSTWRWMAMWMFDEELARAGGVPVRVLRYAMLLAIAGTVIVATRIVGVLLVAALLVLPGATGTLVASRVATITLVSLATAFLGTGMGLAWSSAANVPPGPAITLAAFGLFVAGLFYRSLRSTKPIPSLHDDAYRP